MGLRERKKAATRAAIQQHAMRLFLEKGFAGTTVEEIATAAGVSHMTFFRYFPTKEDAVMADEYDPFIAEAIASRPPDEPPLLKVRRALRASLERVSDDERDFVLARARLIVNTPALRARLWEQQQETAKLIASALVGARTSDAGRRRIEILAMACAAALSHGVIIWAEEEGARDLADVLDEVFDTLQRELGRAGD